MVLVGADLAKLRGQQLGPVEPLAGWPASCQRQPSWPPTLRAPRPGLRGRHAHWPESDEWGAKEAGSKL